MTADDDRRRLLEAFGYTTRQAQFLSLVARHGGHFLRRQYVTFTGTTHGQATVRFLRVALTRGDIRALPAGRAGHVFRVCGRPLDAAVGDAHHRIRPTAWDAVIRALMTVDFVLAHRDAEFWTTEADKIVLLRERAIPDAVWPARHYPPRREHAVATTRYFVDKMPWFRVPGDARLWFAYIDADHTRRGFETFLRQYRALLSSMPSGVVYVAPAVWRAAVETVFRQTLFGGRQVAADSGPVTAYFYLRREIEADRLHALSVAQLDAFRELRSRYASPGYDALYERWLQRPDASLSRLEVDRASSLDCAFRVHALGHHYDTTRTPRRSTTQHDEVT
jgi:hypothetical protein